MSFGGFLEGFGSGLHRGRDAKQRGRLLDILEEDAGAETGTGASPSAPKTHGPGGLFGDTYRGASTITGAAGDDTVAGGAGGDYAAGFDATLAQSESGGRYDVVNDQGYTGKYQFGQARLDDYNRATGGSITTAALRDDPRLQERVQDWHVRDIDGFIDERGLDQYVGKEVGGVPITRDGLRAVAHLGGKGGMARFVESGGEYNPADANGTRLSDYARTHAGGSATPERPRRAPARGRRVDGLGAALAATFLS